MVITAACLDAKNGPLDLLRSRWYETSTGRFTSFDSFEGPNSDPKHLHKYLFGGADPVNNVDPSGHDFSLGSMMMAVGITGLIGGMTNGALSAVFAPSGKRLEAFMDGYASGYLSSAITTGLLLYTKMPLPVASGIGNFAGNLILDYARYFVIGDASKSNEEIWKNAAINGIAGVVWSSFIRKLPGGDNLYQTLSQYREQLAKAALTGIRPTNHPFATPEQIAKALALSAEQTAAVNTQYRAFLGQMTVLLSVDSFGSNSIPSVVQWMKDTAISVYDFVNRTSDELGSRVNG